MIARHRAQRNLTQLAVPSTIGVLRDGNIRWALRSSKHLAPQILCFNHRREWRAFVAWCRVLGDELYGELMSALYDFLQKKSNSKIEYVATRAYNGGLFCVPLFWIGTWRG